MSQETSNGLSSEVGRAVQRRVAPRISSGELVQRCFFFAEGETTHRSFYLQQHCVATPSCHNKMKHEQLSLRDLFRNTQPGQAAERPIPSLETRG